MSRIEFQEVLKLAESNDRIMVAVTNQESRCGQQCNQ